MPLSSIGDARHVLDSNATNLTWANPKLGQLYKRPTLCPSVQPQQRYLFRLVLSAQRIAVKDLRRLSPTWRLNPLLPVLGGSLADKNRQKVPTLATFMSPCEQGLSACYSPSSPSLPSSLRIRWGSTRWAKCHILDATLVHPYSNWVCSTHVAYIHTCIAVGGHIDGRMEDGRYRWSYFYAHTRTDGWRGRRRKGQKNSVGRHGNMNASATA